MTDAIPWNVVMAFSVFSAFVFYQQLHLKNFRGESRTAEIVLSISCFLGIATGIVFLVRYGLRLGWLSPLLLFGISFVSKLVVIALEVVFASRSSRDNIVLSMLGFIGWPVCAFLMFSYMPEVTE